VVRRNKIQHFLWRFSLQGKIRMFKFIKSEYLEIANQMRAYCRKNNKKDKSFESIPGIGGYLASVILAMWRFTSVQ
jgi:hypothetical protein